ncbi:MAG: YdcF family protein [Bacteroidales bacterium]|nr:YdcF family protein [Bacteroidales bacterium]
MLLSKLVIAVVSPLGTALLLLLAGLLALLLSRRRWGVGLVALGLAWLWLWSTPVASLWLRHVVEAPYPARPVAEVPATDAIVVLGGAMHPPHAGNPSWDAHSALDRVLHGARLYRAGKAPWIVLSGGSDGGRYLQPEAESIRDFLLELGVPASAILLESESLNTEANAQKTRSLLEAHGLEQVLLVTSALHMARSVAEFEAADVAVVPSATDYDWPAYEGLRQYVPAADALDVSGRAFKEMVGRWAVLARQW